MGQVHPLPSSPRQDEAPVFPAPSTDQLAANVRFIESASCALCGVKLPANALRYQVVSPRSCDSTITVCHTCRKAALGEGYRPA